ncbi:MAG: hypothetical protein ABI220_05850 [Candidatus Saccharimonadales bacterium]
MEPLKNEISPEPDKTPSEPQQSSIENVNSSVGEAITQTEAAPSPVILNSLSDPIPTPTPAPSSVTAPSSLPSGQPVGSDEPTAVVKVLSVRGLEYLMMTFALWAGAFSITGIILSLINGGTSFSVLAFPVSVLLVSVGFFSFFFLRLKKAELANPNLRLDPSKRRLSQITQVIAYIVCFSSLVGIIFSILAQVSGSLGSSLWKMILDFIIVILVAGGILAYYWNDEHRAR